MTKRMIRMEYAFASGKKNLSFTIKACTNEGCISQIENMLTQMKLTRSKILKIELLEILEFSPLEA